MHDQPQPAAAPVPLAQQVVSRITPEQRARQKAGADLATRDLATWSAMVRYQDQLIRDGHDEVQAERIAWEWYVPGVPWTSPV